MAQDDEQRNAPTRSDSSDTLEGDRPGLNEKEEQKSGDSPDGKESDEKENGDEEKNEEIPKPVGFFDPSLHKVRIEVAWKWLVTSKLLLYVERSSDTDCVQPWSLWLSSLPYSLCTGQSSSRSKRTCLR